MRWIRFAAFLLPAAMFFSQVSASDFQVFLTPDLHVAVSASQDIKAVSLQASGAPPLELAKENDGIWYGSIPVSQNAAGIVKISVQALSDAGPMQPKTQITRIGAIDAADDTNMAGLIFDIDQILASKSNAAPTPLSPEATQIREELLRLFQRQAALLQPQQTLISRSASDNYRNFSADELHKKLTETNDELDTVRRTLMIHMKMYETFKDIDDESGQNHQKQIKNSHEILVVAWHRKLVLLARKSKIEHALEAANWSPKSAAATLYQYKSDLIAMPLDLSAESWRAYDADLKNGREDFKYLWPKEAGQTLPLFGAEQDTVAELDIQIRTKYLNLQKQNLGEEIARLEQMKGKSQSEKADLENQKLHLVALLEKIDEGLKKKIWQAAQ